MTRSGRGDAVRLADILRSAERLDEVRRAGFEAFAESWMAQSAAIRELEVIGEAAGALSAALRDAHREVPWKQMRGFSSFAKYEYWRVDPRLVWSAIEGLPALKARIAAISPRS